MKKIFGKIICLFRRRCKTYRVVSVLPSEAGLMKVMAKCVSCGKTIVHQFGGKDIKSVDFSPEKN